MKPTFSNLGIVGAGAMGRGIAQIAVQAGSSVKLFDMQAGTAQAAQAAVFSQWDKLCEKGRLNPEQTAQYKMRLQCAGTLAELSNSELIVEAVVERLDVKTSLSLSSRASSNPPPCWPPTPLPCRSLRLPPN